MFRGLIDENDVQINVFEKPMKVKIATAKEKGMEQTTTKF